jgi:uncharacterized iron-regulated membrane protein
MSAKWLGNARSFRLAWRVMVGDLLVKLHRWAGLGAGIVLVIVGLSGAILAFREEAEHALHPEIWRSVPSGERLSLEAVLAAVRREGPGPDPLTVRVPRRADESFEVLLVDGRAAYVDAYSGRVLGSRRRNEGFFYQTHRLHTQLVADRVGGVVVTTSTAILLGLALSGLWIGWPKRGKVRQALVLRLGAGGKRLNRDLHTVLGLYTAIVLAVLCVSGLLISGGQTIYPALERLTGATPLPRPPPPPEIVPGKPLIGPTQALAAADRAVPDAATLAVGLPPPKAGFYTIYKRFPEDKTPLGRTRVRVDPYTGEVRFVESSRRGSFAQRLPMKMRALHTGDTWGWPTRILFALSSAWVAGLAVTGFLMWWWRRKKAA